MKLSIVLEWDNALLAEADLGLALLDELGRQIGQLFDEAKPPRPRLDLVDPVELVVVFDDDAADPGQVERTRVAHPPPRPRHFARRGIAAGRDNLLRGRVENGGQHRVWASWNDARRHALRAWRRILRQRDRVQLSAPGVPLAMLIMGAYYGLFLAGDLLTRIAPDLAQRHFRI